MTEPVKTAEKELKLLQIDGATTAIKAAKAALEIGTEMQDGTVYVGTSPDTGKAMYAAPVDAPMKMDFNSAAMYAEKLEVGDKKDFRLPSKAELAVLFDARKKGALKGTFDLTSASWYLSSTPHVNDFVWGQRFSEDGHQYYGFRHNFAPVRCVR